MDIKESIEILEALAAGFSPVTGDQIEENSVLNEREVIRALQLAIVEMKHIIKDKEIKNDVIISDKEVIISEEELKTVISLFQSLEYNPTYSRLTHFFLRTKQFDFPELNTSEYYGKYVNDYSKNDLNAFLKSFLTKNGYTLHGKLKTAKDESPWKGIDFFKTETFNHLTENGINQLKSKINELGILKVENVSEYITNARKNYPRAYESWGDIEKELLSKALDYTNDLSLLAECFQRGNGSIESLGKRIIYEKQQSELSGNEKDID
ncbi:hypothetical protein [Ancylomarina sp. 16SWW S1-10-2]|uniref:hypothetical protein n=1 Tax=Ancylomarina sp. 16SWW S1-10-2 TaxID=2499681 RepID=UPI0012AD2588|nr:hypothetical protein [Ancylomarina sp. 16SWW S1-10-2]MRT92080.1 hypothetical protein [Ancylomarina sp. 16SWW S1-10-2]